MTAYFSGVYVKLFASILDSSIWSEDYPTRLVWITLLAMADAEGIVKASVSGVARRAAVKRQEAERAVRVLLAPDKDRPDQPHEGRRLEVVDGGWVVLNYEKYREIRTQQQLRDAVRQQRHRERSRMSRDASQHAEADADTEAETTKSTALVALKRDAPLVPSSERRNGKPKALPVAAIIAGLQDTGLATSRRETKDAFRDVMVEIIFSYWAKRLGHERALLDAPRRRLLAARLVENGDNLSELLYVVDGALRDEWTMGRAKNSQRKYDGVETIYRDREQIERFAGSVAAYKQGTPHPMAVKYAGPTHG